MALEILTQFKAEDLHQKNAAETHPDILKTLSDIQKDIKKTGDEAVITYTQKFDRVEINDFSLVVSKEEISQAMSRIPTDTLSALKKAKTNIENFHQHQQPKSWTESPEAGVTYGMNYTPLNSVGLYVPGGRAPYPSTVLMDAIPAKIAGVENIIMTTPPNPDGTIADAILVAAELCGVKTIIKAGGAQAIFALAEGTQSVPKVDKIVGPGNIYVDLAKQQVYGQVDIDKPAGPSDVLVYCNNPQFASSAAAEMLAQLEHDPSAIAITLSESKEVLDAINQELDKQLPTLSRQTIIKESLENSALILASNSEESIQIINDIAAEHLVLLTENYAQLKPSIKNAGAIFCGPYTPVTLGDYYAGPNHVLPTSGAARFASPLSVFDFVKFSTELTYSKTALSNAAPTLKTLTSLENFDAHYNAVEQRLNKK